MIEVTEVGAGTGASILGICMLISTAVLKLAKNGKNQGAVGDVDKLVTKELCRAMRKTTDQHLEVIDKKLDEIGNKLDKLNKGLDK